MTLPANTDLPNYPFPANARQFDFEFIRMMMQSMIGHSAEGIAGASLADLAPTPGSGLSINVAAGRAFVKGDDRATQGAYFCYVPATQVVTAAAAHATLPRVDRLVLRVYDADVSGATTKWAVELVQGTPTSGATLANLTGATAVPNGALLLANVLVPAAFAGPFVAATHFSDQRKHVNGSSATLVHATLPANPYDGQEILLQTAAMLSAGTPPYRCRYNASIADAYKWEVIGAQQWTALGPNGVNVSSTTFAAVSGGASLTLPFAGVWDLRTEFRVTRGDANQGTGFLSYAVGATAASGSWAAIAFAPGSGNWAASSKTHRHTITSSGVVVVHRAMVVGVGPDYYDGSLSAVPVRLGP